MKLKLTLALVVFTPTIVMAQAPATALPEIVKEPIEGPAISRPSENGGGVKPPRIAEEPTPAPAATAAYKGRRGTIVNGYPVVEADGSFKGGVTYRYVVEPAQTPINKNGKPHFSN